MNDFKDKLVAVDTKTGDKLIGFLVDPPEDISYKPISKGIWLRRKTHLTFLNEDTVKNIRLAKFMEKEIDRKQG